MDYSRYLVLYSGGADSTFFVESEPTARHLIHYEGLNEAQTKVAAINANLLNRYLQVVPYRAGPVTRDGETNQIHALYDTQMALDACMKAVHHGMAGVVLCFTADDIGIDIDALRSIMKRVEPDFDIALPLIKYTDKKVRSALKKSSKLRYVSCMHSEACGFCAKCLKRK
jgi:7-cyano-7-deazaguanine synthase in queuosine biosynthesis